ncbi:MAG: helix-hairpin-helix domain-containing protein [Pseudomonadota bacterium]
MGRIDINTAAKEILVSELGLSDVVANRVTRMRRGAPFVDEKGLLEVEGIGPATVSRLSGLVYFSPGPGGGVNVKGGAGIEAKERDQKEDEDIDLSNIVEAELELDEKGKIKPKGKIDLGKLLDAVISGFEWSSDKDDDEEKEKRDRYKDYAQQWENWDALDQAAAKVDCPEDKKRRLRDILHNIRTNLRNLGSALRRGDDDQVEQISNRIKAWAWEAKQIIERCKKK